MSERRRIADRLGLVVPPEDPVTETQRRMALRARRSSRWFWFLVTSVLLGATFLIVLAWSAAQIFWYYGGRSLPAMSAHFKHGSIGAELANGMPYRMLKALPKVFPEKFGASGDWSHFGLILEGSKDGSGEPRYDIYEPSQVVEINGKRTLKPGRLVLASNDTKISRGLPIGFATGWRLGIEMAWFNCSVCHTGVVQMPGDARPRIVPGMPANTVDLERLFLALFDMAVDKRFTYQAFADAMKENGDTLWIYERPLWEWLVVPNVRAELIARRSELLPLLDPARAPPMARDPAEPTTPALCEARLKPRAGCTEAIQLETGAPYRRSRPDDTTHWGPGRVDTFNPYKLINFALEADCLSAKERLGVSDFPSIFEQGQRGAKVMHLHWDGNNSSIDERNLSAALGAGVNERTVDHASLARIVDWLKGLAPPASPYRTGLDDKSIARGRVIYREACESCHGYNDDKLYVFEGQRLGTIEPEAYIGTDRARLDSYTPLMEKYQKDRLFCADPEHRFRQFKKTDGYANLPLDGLWLRAPYLHNGSVPTLWDLLQRPADRPVAFRRGAAHIRLDPEKGGFDAPACIPGASLPGRDDTFCFDTKLPGNGNGGHLYGTELSEAAKRDLLAYLLTF